MAEIDAGRSQRLGRRAHDAGDDRVLPLERLGQHLALDHAELPAGQLRYHGALAFRDRRADVALDGGPARQSLETAPVAAAAQRPLGV